VVPEPRSHYAVRFFLLSVALLAVSLGTAFMMIKVVPENPSRRENQFSIAFLISTLLLFTGSFCLFRAVYAVRREKQPLFRSWLKRGLAAGALFVAVQTFALSRLIHQQPPDQAETGAAAFAAVVATLHGMHFVIALLFLCFVTIQALADRYDHEYYMGVTICSWFWHLLGIAWLVILFVMFAARFFS
jgi:nitric oxide reductase NorE protein